MESSLAGASYIGHVKNGAVIFDEQVPFSAGQAVRVEPLIECGAPDPARAELVAKMKRAFDAWTEEDGKLSDEEADCLHIALQQNRGLSFRTQGWNRLVHVRDQSPPAFLSSSVNGNIRQ
jgi:hypothetical protein